MVKHGCLSSIAYTVHAFTSFLYCNSCLGTTGYIFLCVCGMCLFQSDSQAVSACLSRTAWIPAGLCLPVCLFLQDTGSLSAKMHPLKRKERKKAVGLFCCFSAHRLRTASAGISWGCTSPCDELLSLLPLFEDGISDELTKTMLEQLVSDLKKKRSLRLE